MVVRLHQREALAVIEFTVNVERFDFEVEVIEKSKELCEDFGGGVAVCETAHRQCVAFVSNSAYSVA